MLAVLGLSIATYVAFVIIAVVVLAIAGYLIVVAYVLRKVSFTLGTILIGVRSIAYQTEPVNDVVSGIAADVAAIQAALRGLLPAGGRSPASLPRGRSRSRTAGRV